MIIISESELLKCQKFVENNPKIDGFTIKFELTFNSATKAITTEQVKLTSGVEELDENTSTALTCNGLMAEPPKKFKSEEDSDIDYSEIRKAFIATGLVSKVIKSSGVKCIVDLYRKVGNGPFTSFDGAEQYGTFYKIMTGNIPKIFEEVEDSDAVRAELNERQQRHKSVSASARIYRFSPEALAFFALQFPAIPDPTPVPVPALT